MMKNRERRSERRSIEKEKFATIPEKKNNKKKGADDLLPPPPPPPLLPLPIGRSFFKVMIGNYKELMHIPPKFARTFGFLKNRHVYIGDLSGDTWRVKVTVVDSSLVFQEGWKNFVLDHSITVGELVTFKYLGGGLFHALVYGTHACDRPYSPKKSNTESGRKRPISNTQTHERPHFHKMQKISEHVEDSYIPSNGAISKKLSGMGVASVKNASGSGRTRPVEKVAAAAVDASWEQGDIAYDRTSRTHSSATKHRPEYGMENLTIPEEVVYKYLLTEDGTCHIVEESSLLETSQIRSLSPGKKTMKKSVEMDNGNIRPSDAEINFKFSVTLPAQSTWLVLPEFLWHEGRMKLDRKVIILQDPSMNMWPVVYHASPYFVGFLGGWKDFVMANNLHQGDICEFEAVDRTECTFQVHVTR